MFGVKAKTAELAALLFILLLSVACFAPGLNFPFVYDDLNQIVRNPAVQDSRGLISGFFESVWAHKEAGSSVY